jgi:hypothetical protein
MRKHEISTEQAEQEYAERERLEALLNELPEPTTVAEDIQQMQSVGLYCGTCGHGNGCEHGVPASR